MSLTDLLTVERLGGLAGFGGFGSKLKSRGQVRLASLCEADQLIVEQWFEAPPKRKPASVADGFCYKITRTSKQGLQSVEVPEDAVPAAIIQCVKDELT